MLPLILLPPSEGKAVGGRGAWAPASGRFADLAAARAEVAAALAAAMDDPEAAGRALGVRGAHLERAAAGNAALVGAPTLPAWARYTGVVWDHLAPATLSPAARRRARATVVVVSGLAGVAAFDDPLPDYRARIGASLPGLGRLATWWRPRLAPVLDDLAAGRVVVDLLPAEHAAAWTPTVRPTGVRRVVRVRFERVDAGRRTVVGHDAKAAKGRLARALLEAGGDPVRTLRRVAPEGWAHDDDHDDHDDRGGGAGAGDGSVVTVRYVRR